MLAINTNIASINAVNRLQDAQGELSTAMERLSSGRRINSAADDAAGYSVAVSMDKQIKGLNQAVRNVNDGVSLTQTALGAMEEMTDMLQRMRELSVQSNSGTYAQEDRDAMQLEYTALADELDRISQTTKFNGQALLDNGAGFAIQAGWENDAGGLDLINITTADLTLAGLGLTNANNVDSVANADATITALDTAIQTMNGQAAAFGAVQNRLEYTADNLANVSEKISSAKSRIWDTDFASESARLSKSNVLQQAGQAMLAQANQQPQQVLQLLR